ncbi:MAG: hypothetical protein ABSF34_12840 [Verrucomicrobiota bacterium]|jgi:hypothetical protein
MKTPREILLARHRAVETKLDAIRSEVLAQSRDGQRAAIPKRRVNYAVAFPILLWRELILPSHRVWTGLAAVWALIMAVHFSLRDPGQPGMAKVTAPEMMSFQEQQKLVNELLADRFVPVDFDRQKTFTPRPRSERVVVLTV